MKHFGLPTVKFSWQTTELWFSLLGATLIALHLMLIWAKTHDMDLLGIAGLFWGAVIYLLWHKTSRITWRREAYSTGGGLLLLGWVLLESVQMSGYQPFLRIMPLLIGLGLGLFASSAKYLRQYSQELSILLIFAVPEAILAQMAEQLIDITTLAAKSATGLLWYLGFSVRREGVNILLPTGGVEVYIGCSGLKASIELLRLSVLYLLIFPSTLREKLIVPVTAIALAFGVNVIRLALMTLLSASGNQSAFNYWHIGDGSNIFAVISMLCFAIFCHFLIQSHEQSESTLSGN